MRPSTPRPWRRDGHWLAVGPPGQQSSDGVPGIFGLKGDAFDRAFENVGHILTSVAAGGTPRIGRRTPPGRQGRATA
jgi:hypothetical protein